MDAATRRVTVITGGAGGIAMACARRLGDDDVILLADRDEAALAAAAAALGAEGIEAHTAVADMRDAGAIAALVDAAAAIGPMHALVHTAGIAPPGATDPDLILEINLAGTVRLLDAFEPSLTQGTVGVLIASLGGHRGFTVRPDALEHALTAPGPAYAFSKRGVMLEVERRAAAWGARGARLVSVSPGLVLDTGIGREAQKIVGGYARQSAMGRAAEAADVAGLVRFLSSDEASYITGCDILIDGGVRAAIDWHTDPDARERWHAAR